MNKRFMEMPENQGFCALKNAFETGLKQVETDLKQAEEQLPKGSCLFLCKKIFKIFFFRHIKYRTRKRLTIYDDVR